jgi:hypothetical protein
MELATSMEGIHARARELGVDLDSVDLDSITLPPGENFDIVRYPPPRASSPGSQIRPALAQCVFVSSGCKPML